MFRFFRFVFEKRAKYNYYMRIAKFEIIALFLKVT